MVRRIFMMPVSKLAQAKVVALRSLAVTTAKYAALATIMYAVDWDDQLSDPAFWASDVTPYMQNADHINSFIYTYNGTRNMSEIRDPKTTVLGYMLGPGGRAVVYADGDTKWIPDPPTGGAKP